jgi:hypothetical protein
VGVGQGVVAVGAAVEAAGGSLDRGRRGVEMDLGDDDVAVAVVGGDATNRVVRGHGMLLVWWRAKRDVAGATGDGASSVERTIGSKM